MTSMAQDLREAVTVLDEPFHRESVSRLLTAAADHIDALEKKVLAMMLDPLTSREQWDAEETERLDEWAEDQHQTELELHAKALWTRTKVTGNGEVRTQPHRLEILARNLHKVSRYGAGEGHESEYQMDLLLTEWGPGKLIAYFGALAETEGQ